MFHGDLLTCCSRLPSVLGSMHAGACLFAEDPGRQLRARQAAARHDNPVHAAEAVASRRQSIAACKAHITMALNRDDIAKANKMVRQLGILHPDAKQEIEEQAKRVSRASLGLAIRQAQDAVNVADEASTGSGLAVRHEQLHRQALPAERHVRFSVSEDSRPRSSSRLSTRATESAATEVSEDGAPVVSPARREPSLYPLLSFCHSLTLSLCLSLAYSPPPRLCPG